MQSISGINHVPMGSYVPAAGREEPEKIRQPEEKTKESSQKPVRDEYVPEKKPGPDGAEKNGKSCTCNTDKVDREIEKLKKQKQELTQQISRETDGSKVKALQKQLAQVERELSQKDNDTYRRQNAVYTFS